MKQLSLKKWVKSWIRKSIQYGKSFGKKIILGFDSKGRFWRYFIVILIGITLIWSLCFSYLILTPKKYETKYTLILPGAGAGATINIENIGQATTTTSSAYSSSSLSPTENYKRILMSPKITEKAASRLNIPTYEIHSPKIKLIDQTSLIFIQSTADSASKAKLHGETIIYSLKETLDELRREESKIREADYKQKLKELQNSVTRSRNKLLKHQADTGLITIDHYHSIVESVETVRQEAQKVESSLEEKIAEKEALIYLLNRNPKQAAQAIVLRSDPVFQSLISNLVEIETHLTEYQSSYGSKHPKLKELLRKKYEFKSRISERGQFILEDKEFHINRNRDLSIQNEQASLFHQFALVQVEIEALKGRLSALRQQVKLGEKRVEKITRSASILDDLTRDHKIAETVFASVLARVDTTRTDFYASYPLVQVYEAPKLIDIAISPKKTLAIIGGGGASFFYIFGIIMLCLRRPLILSLLKNI